MFMENLLSNEQEESIVPVLVEPVSESERSLLLGGAIDGDAFLAEKMRHRESALAKLLALGLTESEINSIL